MDIIRKIQLSQKHLKNILSDEFDTTPILELSVYFVFDLITGGHRWSGSVSATLQCLY